MSLTLDEQKHEYRWNGNPVDSVTQIIGEYVKVSFSQMSSYYVNIFTGNVISLDIFEGARDTGKAIHLACNILAQGKSLDWNALDPSLLIPLQSFINWLNDFKPSLLWTENRLYSEVDNFAGTPDNFCEIRGKLSLIEIKTPITNLMVGPQTAAYEKLIRESEKVRAKIQRYELQISRAGDRYKFNPLNNYSDLPFFLSRLYQKRYLNGKL
jgi:hypothetical protein